MFFNGRTNLSEKMNNEQLFNAHNKYAALIKEVAAVVAAVAVVASVTN